MRLSGIQEEEVMGVMGVKEETSGKDIFPEDMLDGEPEKQEGEGYVNRKDMERGEGKKLERRIESMSELEGERKKKRGEQQKEKMRGKEGGNGKGKERERGQIQAEEKRIGRACAGHIQDDVGFSTGAGG